MWDLIKAFFSQKPADPQPKVVELGTLRSPEEVLKNPPKLKFKLQENFEKILVTVVFDDGTEYVHSIEDQVIDPGIGLIFYAEQRLPDWLERCRKRGTVEILRDSERVHIPIHRVKEFKTKKC